MFNQISTQEAELMDRIFHLEFKENVPYNPSYYYKQLNIESKELCEYLHQAICEILDSIDHVKLQTFNSGKHTILRFDKIKCNKFISSGGFKAYFDGIKTTQNESEDLTNQIKSIISGMNKPWYSKPVFWIPVIISILALFKDQIIPNDKTNNTIERSEVITIIDSVLKASNHQHDNPSNSSIIPTTEQKDSITSLIDSSHLNFKDSTSN